MPTYDLHCPACTFRYEVIRGINAPNPPCPNCGGRDAEQVWTGKAPEFTLRGEGWAASLYSKETKG